MCNRKVVALKILCVCVCLKEMNFFFENFCRLVRNARLNSYDDFPIHYYYTIYIICVNEKVLNDISHTHTNTYKSNNNVPEKKNFLFGCFIN